MLKTLLSAIAVCFACLMLAGCGGDDVGSVDDHGGERVVDDADKISSPGGGVDPDDDLMSQDQDGGG